VIARSADVERGRRREVRAAAIAVTVALLAAALLAAVYVGSERSIYFWDFALYWDRTRETLELWQRDPGLVLGELVRSLRYDDYNALPAVGLLPAVSLLGVSRCVEFTLCVSFTRERQIPGGIPPTAISPAGSRIRYWRSTS